MNFFSNFNSIYNKKLPKNILRYIYYKTNSTNNNYNLKNSNKDKIYILRKNFKFYFIKKYYKVYYKNF